MSEASQNGFVKQSCHSRQWECPGNEKLTGHEPFLRGCRWRGSIHPPTGPGLALYCQSFFVDAQKVIHLRDALVDTSERFQGTLVTKRLTWHREMILVGYACVFTAYDPPCRHEEAAATTKTTE